MEMPLNKTRGTSLFPQFLPCPPSPLLYTDERLMVPRVNRFLQLRKMEAAREIAGMVANSNNKLMLDSDALMFDRKFFFCFPSSLLRSIELMVCFCSVERQGDYSEVNRVEMSSSQGLFSKLVLFCTIPRMSPIHPRRNRSRRCSPLEYRSASGSKGDSAQERARAREFRTAISTLSLSLSLSSNSQTHRPLSTIPHGSRRRTLSIVSPSSREPSFARRGAQLTPSFLIFERGTCESTRPALEISNGVQGSSVARLGE